MKTPENGIPMGSLFGYGPQAALNELWTKDQGTFSLGSHGDNIFLYCLTSLNQKRFLSAFSNAGPWKPPHLDQAQYAQNRSALPDALVGSEVSLPHLMNYHYNGPRDARINLLRRSILDPAEWQGSNVVRYRMEAIEEDADGSSGVMPRIFFACSVLSLILVLLS